MMTYNELLGKLSQFTVEQLAMNVTIRDASIDEFFPVQGMGFSADGDAADGILDHGHPYLQAATEKAEADHQNEVFRRGGR
jgi:hypothetical protein